MWKIIDGKLVKLDTEGATLETRDLTTVLTTDQLDTLDPTEDQLASMVEEIATEIGALGNGDKTAGSARRIRELASYRNTLAASLNEIRTPAEPAVEIKPVAVAEPATPVTDPTPTGEGVAVAEVPEAAPVAEPELVLAGLDPDDAGISIDPGTLVEVKSALDGDKVDWADLTGQETLAAMRAGLETDTTELMARQPHMHGLAIRASLGGGNGFDEVSANWARQAMNVANKFIGRKGSVTDGSALFEWAPMLASLDPRTGSPLAKMGRNAETNQALLDDPAYMAMSAAMFAELCGLPAVDSARVDPCGIRTDEPIVGAMATPVPISTGRLNFYQGVYDISMLGGTLPQLWFEANQAAVDPADRATWKGCATLPACDDQVTVPSYMLPTCLTITTEDEISRPEVIEQANMILRVLQARLSESYRLDIIDAYTGVSGHIYKDDWASTTYGAALQFQNSMTRLTIGLAQYGRKDLSDLDVIVPAHLVKLLWLDEVNSGTSRASLGNMTTWMENQVTLAGFRSLVITPDYGSAEGATFGALTPGGVVGQAATDPYAQPVATRAFGASADSLPALPTTATIRATNLQEFRPGLSTVVPWELRRSPELMRQNKAEIFGESGHMLYKKGCSDTFRLDITNICVNGARPALVAPFAC